MPDIDIDFADRNRALAVLQHIDARLDSDKKHNTGIYCTSIPYNPITGISTINYKEAENRGYFKIDFLNVSVYEGVKSKDHLTHLLNAEPIWDLLEQKEFCDMIFHINGYHNLIAKLKPKSIEELAMFLALIRPGKKHLIPICEQNGFQAIENDIWQKTEESYFFKKSHATSYACVIVVQMNLICERISYEFS
jgi:DNA polymerase III alpha subunit